MIITSIMPCWLVVLLYHQEDIYSPGQLQLAGKFFIHFVEMFDVYYGK